MIGLTNRQKSIMDFIVEFMREKEMAPTIREIGAAFDIRSTNGVIDHLKALTRKGWLRRLDYKSRSLMLSQQAKDEYGFSSKNYHEIIEQLEALVEGFPPNLEERIKSRADTRMGAAMIVICEVEDILKGEAGPIS